MSKLEFNTTVSSHNSYILKCLCGGKKKLLAGSDYFQVVDLIPNYKSISEDDIHEYLVILPPVYDENKSTSLKIYATSPRSVKQYLGRDQDLRYTQKILLNLDDDEIEIYFRQNNNMWGWTPFSKIETLFLLTDCVEKTIREYNKEAARIND